MHNMKTKKNASLLIALPFSLMSLAVTASLSHADDIFIKYPEARHITFNSGEKEIIEKQENLLEYYVYMEEKHADLSSGKLLSGAHYDEDQAFEEFLDENKERFDKERERLENQLEYRINAFADQTNADEELTQAEAEALIQSTANEWRVEAYNEWRKAKFDSWKRQKELKAQQRLLMLEQQYGVPFRTFRQYAILNKLKNPLAPAHINNVEDAGFQLQAIKPDWRSIAGITQHNWPQRIEITDEYSINTATKLMSLLNNAIKQMPERSGEILQGDLPSDADLACQAKIDDYTTNAMTYIEQGDVNGLTYYTLGQIKNSIEELRDGYKRSGEFALVEQHYVSKPMSLYNDQFFKFIDNVNSLEVHDLPEGQIKAKELRKNEAIQQLELLVKEGLPSWYRELAEQALVGQLSSENSYDMSMLAIHANPQRPITELYEFSLPAFSESQKYATNLISYANLTDRPDILQIALEHQENSELNLNLNVLLSSEDFINRVRSITAPQVFIPNNASQIDQDELLANRAIEDCAKSKDVVMTQTMSFVRNIANLGSNLDYASMVLTREEAYRNNPLNANLGIDDFAKNAFFGNTLQSMQNEIDNQYLWKSFDSINKEYLSVAKQELDSNGGWQIIFEGISGVPMHWVDKELFDLLLNYKPKNFRQIDDLRLAIEDNPPSPQVDFYLKLIDLAVTGRMQEPTRFSLAVALASYSFLSFDENNPIKSTVLYGQNNQSSDMGDPCSAEHYSELECAASKHDSLASENDNNKDHDAYQSLRDSDGHEAMIHYAGMGYDNFSNTLLPLISSYTSLFFDPEEEMWKSVRSGIKNQNKNLDEYSFAWEDEIKKGFPRYSFERDGARTSIFWCIQNSHERTVLNGTPDHEPGIFYMYDNVRHNISKIKIPLTPMDVNGNGHWRNGIMINPNYYNEGHYVRSTGLLAGKSQGALEGMLDAYVETMRPSVYGFEYFEEVYEKGNDNVPDSSYWYWQKKIGYGYEFDGRSGYQWNKFTCRLH